MFKSLADFLSLKLTTNKIIDINDRENYTYGLELFLIKVVFFSIILVLALLTDSLIISLLFTTFYLSLRKYTGGYHSKTSGMCLIISLLIYLMMLFFERADFNSVRTVLMVLSVISFIIIIIFSPVENENNPITSDEKIKYKKISIIISFIIVIITGLSFFYNYHYLFYSSAWSISTDAILIILTKGWQKEEKADY